MHTTDFASRQVHTNLLEYNTFLPYDIMLKKANSVQHLKSFARETFSVDASFSPVCKWNHRFFDTARMWEADYYNLYSLNPEGMGV